MRTIVLRTLLTCLILYWGAFAMVAPITVWDSQTYNIARIPLALAGGLFGNPYWNSDRQGAFPWSFDALHLIFFWLGGGASLPSYFCFLGTLAIIWTIINTHRGPTTATLCALGMFAMPTLIYQATSSKNDWAVVFGAACWFYFLWLHVKSPNKWLVWGMALSVAFTAGAKSAGLPLAILATLTTFYVLRRHRRDVFQFSGGLLLSIVLWGSVETYINNVSTYGNPLGSQYILRNKNNDGLRGATANAIRYGFGAVNFGTDERGAGFLDRKCLQLLNLLGLHNVGYREDYDDAHFALLKKGWEAASDFGVLGFFSMAASVCIMLRGAWRTIEWRLAASGFLCFGLVCATVAWMPWNLRYLMLPFLLFLLAFILTLDKSFVRKPWLKWLVYLLLVHGIIVYPVRSFNKSPRDFWAAIVRRDDATFKEEPSMEEVFQEVRNDVGKEKMRILFLKAAGDSWILPFFELKKLKVIPCPHITEPPAVTGLLHEGESAGLLVLDSPFTPKEDKGWRMYRQFSEPDSTLYLWRNSRAVASLIKP
jgi:hypothetical protein